MTKRKCDNVKLETLKPPIHSRTKVRMYFFSEDPSESMFIFVSMEILFVWSLVLALFFYASSIPIWVKSSLASASFVLACVLATGHKLLFGTTGWMYFVLHLMLVFNISSSLFLLLVK